MQHTPKKPTKTRLYSLGAAWVAILLPGCSHPTNPPHRNPASTHLYVGIDTSTSFRSHLPDAAQLTTRAASQFEPDRDCLTIYREDHETREFFDGPAPDSADSLESLLVDSVAKDKSPDGTYPAPFWQEATRRAATDKGQIIVLLVTDGDNDDMRRESFVSISQSAATLARNPRVSAVIICGANPANWSTLRSEFAALGDRLHLLGPSQISLDAVEQYLQVAG